MALNKIQINLAGVQTNYHKISQVNLNNNQLFCELSSYTSKEYRSIDYPVYSTAFIFDITIDEEESMGIRQLCYKKIKELEEWSDAEDC